MKTTPLKVSLAKLVLLFGAALAAFTHPANAAPGDLDPTFGGSGKVTTSIGNGMDVGLSVVIQSDGQIVVAGSSEIGGILAFTLVRYQVNGSLDTTFNGTGKVITDIGPGGASGNSMALQNDGRIVVAGGSQGYFALARYNPDGSLDTSLGGTGKITTEGGSGNSVALQSDEKIVVAGISNGGVGVVRYNPNGSLDTTFGGTGKVTTAVGNSARAFSVALQGDGKIVVAGNTHNTYDGNNTDFLVVRYNANGTLDTTFNGTGIVITEFNGQGDSANSLVVGSDGRIVVAGYSYAGPSANSVAFAVVRYNSNGSLDTTFNGTGKVTTDIRGGYDAANSVALQGNGKIVVAGSSAAAPNSNPGDFAVVFYNPNGSLDTSFNHTGKVTTDLCGDIEIGNSVAVQSDWNIVVAGSVQTGSNSAFALARYEGKMDTDGDGIADQYETGTGIYVSPQDTGTSPANPDTDGDGLTDGQEVNTYHSNPNVKDTDGDGFDDGFEVSTGFSPISAASTPDVLSSIRTAAEYRFNAGNGISYRIEASTDLANWQTIEPIVIGTGGVITRFYSIEGQAKRFFRSLRN